MNEETVLETTIQTDPPTEPATEPVQTETTPSDPGLVTEPTVVPETVPETTAAESAPETLSEEDPEELDGTEATIYEDLIVSENEEYTAATEAVNVVEVIESVGSDIAHANLFGSFLICGTLLGLGLLRKIYGT